MSLTSEGMTPADIRACTCDGNNNGWGGDFSSWIVIFLIFAMFGNRGFGWGNGNNDGGVANNYVLNSDFATLQRQLSDGFNAQERKLDSISNGLCDGFYTQAQLVNGVNMNIAQNGYESRLATQQIGSQLANCCCDIREGIQANTTQGILNTNQLQQQINQCCCDNEKLQLQSRYENAQMNCNTLQAIDKVGDRIIDYLANDKAQALRDENQALRLAASQQAQNNYLVNQLRPSPNPAYVVPNPYCNCGNGCGNGCGC